MASTAKEGKWIPRLRILLVIAVLLIVGIRLGTWHYSGYREQQRLETLLYYELYSSYIQTESQYHVYLMLKPALVAPDSFEDTVLTPEFVKEMVAQREYGHHPTLIYVVFPGEDLPYGSWKREMVLDHNDLIEYRRHALYTVTIPVSTSEPADCFVEYFNQT